MKRILTLLFVLATAFSATANGGKLSVAVFDPTSSGTSIDEGTRIAIREIISSTIVNTGEYNLVERSLLEKVMQEQQFNNSGMVTENDATEIGKLAGANKIVLSVVTLTGGRNMLSIKMIDVKTASVERQKVKLISSGELLDSVEPLTFSVLGVDGVAESTSYAPVKSQNVAPSRGERTPSSEATPEPGGEEIVLYLAPGYEPKKKAEDASCPIALYFDKEYMGGGTLSEGFTIRIPNTDPGEKRVRIESNAVGSMTKMKLNTEKFNYFEFVVSEWRYLGVPMYSIVLKNQSRVE